MVAVVMMANSVVPSVAVLMVGALIVLAAGAGPLLNWLASAWRVKRFAVAVVFAIAMALALAAKTEAAIIRCDWPCWWI